MKTLKGSGHEKKLKLWQAKLDRYLKKYNRLKKQSPQRWWHDEFFENQMKVLEEMIVLAKTKINELKKQERSKKLN